MEEGGHVVVLAVTKVVREAARRRADRLRDVRLARSEAIRGAIKMYVTCC